MACFGEILSELCQDQHLTQAQLASQLHVSVGTISNYENGVHTPDLDKLQVLADFFQVTTDYLLGRTPHNLPFEILQKNAAPGVKMYDLLQALNEMDAKHLQAFSVIITMQNEKCNI